MKMNREAITMSEAINDIAEGSTNSIKCSPLPGVIKTACVLWWIFSALQIGSVIYQEARDWYRGYPEYTYWMKSSSNGFKNKGGFWYYQCDYHGAGALQEIVIFINVIFAFGFTFFAWRLWNGRVKHIHWSLTAIVVLGLIPVAAGYNAFYSNQYMVGIMFLSVGILFYLTPTFLAWLHFKKYIAAVKVRSEISPQSKSTDAFAENRLKLMGIVWIGYGLMTAWVVIWTLISWLEWGVINRNKTLILNADASVFFLTSITKELFGDVEPKTHYFTMYAGFFLRPQWLALVWGLMWVWLGIRVLLGTWFPTKKKRFIIALIISFVVVMNAVFFLNYKQLYTVIPSMIFPGSLFVLLPFFLMPKKKTEQKLQPVDFFTQSP
jgi:hypothetical protein